MKPIKPVVGVCYYPEQWPEALWSQDAERMVDHGITWVRIGEFAWSRIEPQPEQFAWDWLDQAIDTLGQAGLNIVLGTPTATPPRWMLDKHPQMLAVDQNGQPRGFGSRRHYDFSYLPYREESGRICSLLAARYADHSAIGFWQTDNEYGCHDTTISYSAAALQGFQQWLQQKYANIELLNTAWGNVFWSMEYRDFSEIALPNLTVTEANPAHVHDFRRYSSEQVVLFNRAQVEAIRAHDAATPILHNYMGRITDFDHFAVGEDLDAASWDSYPLGFLEDRSEDDVTWKRQFQRQGDPDFQAFHHDLYRAVGKGRWWVMEQQPGPVNWAPYNPAPLAGMVRLWGWEAVAHGAEVVSYFRWRQAPFAQEQMHSGLLRPDNQPAPALAEVQQLAQELQSYPEPKPTQAAVAIVFDYESAWAWETQPQGRDFDYFRLVFEQYRALRRLGLSIDICAPNTRDFSAYQWVLVPGLMHWKADLKQALQHFNGQVLIGPRTGSKTQNFSIPLSLPPDCGELVAVKVAYVESLSREGEAGIRCWREHLEPGAGVEVSLADTGGRAVCVKQGNVNYLGAWLDDAGYRDLFTNLCDLAGLPILHLPEGVRVRQWGQYWVVVNYSSKVQSLAALAEHVALPQMTIEPAGVLVLEFYTSFATLD